MFKYDLIKDLVQMCKIWIRSFIKVLSCMTGCFGQPDEAACQFICQWELGQSNEKYLKLLTCMGENGCLTMQPDGVCLSSARYSIVIVQTCHKRGPPVFGRSINPISTRGHIVPTQYYIPLIYNIDKNRAFLVQVNLCQKLLFLH